MLGGVGMKQPMKQAHACLALGSWATAQRSTTGPPGPRSSGGYRQWLQPRLGTPLPQGGAGRRCAWNGRTENPKCFRVAVDAKGSATRTDFPVYSARGSVGSHLAGTMTSPWTVPIWQSIPSQLLMHAGGEARRREVLPRLPKSYQERPWRPTCPRTPPRFVGFRCLHQTPP